ncbi:hypothetical protein LEM8419_02259 [Neolewinella maritima]|uniref:Tetratricopeptide repeat protein n=1 Tax=Neolewinella maritima TaxID=1383882 RepID=A0ABN8F305_9BACT|nr:hypothetical protein [Neolewinella maritima]CAH1001358.1 hypothetical protein LEM8419_02259 [Neolewinella maritima]
MNAQDFLHYLEQPDLLASLPLSDLIDLSERYPYAPNVHLLTALRAKKEQHPELEHYLSRFAAATFDRPHLYNLLHRMDQRVSEADDTLELIALDELELAPLTHSPAPPQAAEALPSRLNRVPPKPTPPPPPPPIRGDEGEDVRPSRTPPSERSGPVSTPSEWVATAAAFHGLYSSSAGRSRATLPALESSAGAAPQDASVFTPIAAKYRAAMALRSRLEQLRMQRAQARSVTEGDPVPEGIVSETLAELLVRQEQYHHAIRMYQRLVLLYPQKKPIFAGRIQELREKI